MLSTCSCYCSIPAWPLTGPTDFFMHKVRLPLYVPTGCLTHHRNTVRFLERLFPQDPRSLRSLLTLGARVGSVGRDTGLTHGHFYCPVGTSCFPQCFWRAVRSALHHPAHCAPLHTRAGPAPRTLCSPPAPPRLTLKASTCLPAFIRPASVHSASQGNPGGLHLAHSYTWFGLYSFIKKRKNFN